MKKLFLGMLILGIMVVGVSAGVIYYNSTINVNADITEPFVTSTFPLSFNGYATEIMEETITIENKATGNLPANITWLPRIPSLVIPDMMSITKVNDAITSIDLLSEGKVVQIPNGINTLTISFRTQGANIGALNLAKKTVDFTKDVWDVLEDQVTMEYSKIGDKFTAEVVNGSDVNYVLIYYADADNRFDNPAQAILIEDVEGSLPYTTDANSDIELYNYCETNEYSTCNGAKIWYVPRAAILDGNELDWSMADQFYFETDLIEYTQSDTDSIGIITVQRTD